MIGTATHSFEDLDMVALLRPVDCDAAIPLPAGSIGTIVAVLKDSVAYVVEFVEPFAALVDVDAHDLVLVPSESRDHGLAERMADRAP